MMPGNGPTRVAIVGASGIGKHHAKWWALDGAAVCGFVGTSEVSVARTREVLEKLFGFEGRGYTSLEALLDAEAPDVVDICSPVAFHAAHARVALEAGCHVLCEKPLFYDPSLSPDAMLDEARAVVALAEEKGMRLGVCTQYSIGAGIFARIWKENCGNAPITHYYGCLESPAKGRASDPGRVWVDLSPHPLSVLVRLAPGGTVSWSTLEVAFKDYEARASFELHRPSGPVVQCEIIARNATEPPLNVRHFKWNDYAYTVEGANDADGVYCARIKTSDGEYHEPDMMRSLIRSMLEGRPAVTGHEALINLEWMLQILDFAKED